MKLTFKLNLYYDTNSKEYGFMKCEKKKILAGVKEHERELIIAGCSAFFVTVAIVGFKNKNIFCELVSLLRKYSDNGLMNNSNIFLYACDECHLEKDLLVESIRVFEKMPHHVSSHLRTLPEGCKASAEKIASAMECGYDLLPGQTWVKEYQTGRMAA